jgi:glutathione S-transferase
MSVPILYHSVSARSLRPLWVFEELGMPYELHMLAFPPRAHTREYLQVNPLGTVPALAVDGGIMTESVAMCQYLVAQQPASPLAMQPGETGFSDYLNFLYFGEATLTFPQRPAYLRALESERVAALAQGVSPDPSPAMRPWE